MSSKQQPRPKRRKGGRTGEKRGAWKIRVWFIEHRLPTAWTAFSSQRQDRNNNAFVRNMKQRIEPGGIWHGKVNHVTLYHNTEPIVEYTDWNREWKPPAN